MGARQIPKEKHYCSFSLEAKHLIWVWIMKVKGPKNQVDFIEILYVVVNTWGATGPPKDEIYT